MSFYFAKFNNSICPRCKKEARLWIVDPGPSHDSSQKGCACLCIFPASKVREPIIDLSEINEPIARAYQATLDAYNTGLWAPCAASCRRTLEGLIQILLPEDERKGALAQQLKSLPQHVNLAEPIIALADNLRKGGNIGAHFDLEKEPNQEIAEAMVDLLDYFVEYVYVLRGKAESLEKRIKALGSK